MFMFYPIFAAALAEAAVRAQRQSNSDKRYADAYPEHGDPDVIDVQARFIDDVPQLARREPGQVLDKHGRRWNGASDALVGQHNLPPEFKSGNYTVLAMDGTPLFGCCGQPGETTVLLWDRWPGIATAGACR